MRKNLLALSIAAMIGGVAHAAVISNVDGTAVATGVAGALSANVPGTVGPLSRSHTTLNAATALSGAQVGGIGHILLVPYFTTQANKQTLLNLVNTDLVNGKAVKVRYRGASNSDDIFDITVYLSPGDVWTGTVTANGTISKFLTNDSSCTIPSKAVLAAGNNGNFKTDRVRNNDPLQTREGYIEILNTADVPQTRVANADLSTTGVRTANPLFAATKHGIFTAPSCDANVVLAQANDLIIGAGGNNFHNRGYGAPTGGLFANWTIVDLAKQSTTTGEAISVRAVDGGGANAAGNIVWGPQTGTVVAQNLVEQWTADPLLTTGAYKTSNATGAPVLVTGATAQDFPDLSTPYTGAGDPEVQAARLTASLSTTAITNEYITDGAFSTDWLLSMPTRRYHLAANYAGTGSIVFNTSLRTNSNATRNIAPVVAELRGAAAVAGDATQPGAGAALQTLAGIGFGWFNQNNSTWDQNLQQICVTPGAIRSFDREENESNPFTVSPTTALRFCGETNVIAFNNKDSVLGAALTLSRVTTLDQADNTRVTTGWATIATPASIGAGGGAAGLPITGYAAVAFSGANLGGTWQHR